jgi:hypothetical protein
MPRDTKDMEWKWNFPPTCLLRTDLHTSQKVVIVVVIVVVVVNLFSFSYKIWNHIKYAIVAWDLRTDI